MEVTINDLRRLSRFGNVTAKLDHTYGYKIGTVKRRGVYILQPNSYVDGKRSEISIEEPYAKAYKHIQTVKQGNQLIAERRSGVLQATAKFEQRLREERKETCEK